MEILALEHSRAAYRADFVLYGAAVVGLPAFLILAQPLRAWPELAALALLGLASWTLIEYAMHRLILHGLALADVWSACALTLGLLIGYFGYAVTHHATHHWNLDNAWLKRRKRAHALHHHLAQPGSYGVTSSFRDRVFGPNKDFKPISLLAKVPSLYVVHPDVPAKNLKEFVALCTARPGQLNHGSAGNGSAGHLAFEYLKMAANIFILHVPYRGTGPQLTDRFAGRLQAASVGAARQQRWKPVIVRAKIKPD